MSIKEEKIGSKKVDDKKKSYQPVLNEDLTKELAKQKTYEPIKLHDPNMTTLNEAHFLQ